MIILLMGVQGSGKTTVGRALAARLGWRFADADEFHPAANIAKMSAGLALNDDDRAPWLAALRAEIDRTFAKGENLVLTSSALKEKYRRQLLTEGVRLVYLRGTQEMIASRLRERQGHFAKSDLLASQFAQLEEPQTALTVDINASVEDIATKIIEGLDLAT